ncbi:MAG: hypothetical protein ACXAEF_05855 [Candidatus Thorarchaeota archaeon]
MQVLEITLTVLATALPAILIAVVAIEIYGITKITQRLNSLIRGMESPEALDNTIQSVIVSTTAPAAKEPAKKKVKKKKKKEPVKVEDDFEDVSLDELEEEPEIITTFDFEDDESIPSKKPEPKEATPKSRVEPMAFDDTLEDDSLDELFSSSLSLCY